MNERNKCVGFRVGRSDSKIMCIISATALKPRCGQGSSVEEMGCAQYGCQDLSTDGRGENRKRGVWSDGGLLDRAPRRVYWSFPTMKRPQGFYFGHHTFKIRMRLAQFCPGWGLEVRENSPVKLQTWC